MTADVHSNDLLHTVGIRIVDGGREALKSWAWDPRHLLRELAVLLADAGRRHLVLGQRQHGGSQALPYEECIRAVLDAAFDVGVGLEGTLSAGHNVCPGLSKGVILYHCEHIVSQKNRQPV